jgi:hypothetical protein
MVELYVFSPIRLHGVVLHSLSTGTTLPLPSATEHDYIFFSPPGFAIFVGEEQARSFGVGRRILHN